MILRSKYKIIFLFSVFIGFCFSIPNIYLYFSTSIDRVYIPISFAELLYAAQVNEVLAGNLFVGDPQFFESKYHFPPAFPLLPVYVLTLLSIISGSIVNSFFISDFIFPIVLFILLFIFFRKITHFDSYSIFAACTTLTLYTLLSKITPLSFEQLKTSLKVLSLIDVGQPLAFYRTPNPQISFIVLLLALFYLYKNYQNTTFKNTFLTIIFGSLLFTTYFYHAIFFFFTSIFLTFISLFQKNKNLQISLASLCLFLLITTLFFKNISDNPKFASLKVNGGVFYYRYFDYIFTLRYGFIVGLIYLLRKKLQKNTYFLLSLKLGAISCMNFQLFTGWTIQPAHFVQTTLEPILIITLLVILHSVFKTAFTTKRIYLLTFIILFYASLHQIRFTLAHQNDWTISKDFQNILVWLNKYTDKNTVITSLDVNLLNYIQGLTQTSIFVPVEQYHYASIQEIWERLLINYKIYGYNSLPNEEHISYGIHFELAYNVNRYKHQNFLEYSPEIHKKITTCYPSLCSSVYALPQSVLSEYTIKYEQIDLKQRPYKLNLAIYSPLEKNLGTSKPKGKRVYVSGDYEIYEIILN